MKPLRPKQSERGGIILKLIGLTSLLTLSIALYLVRHPVFRFVAESWVVEDPLNNGKADALMVLSDDNFYADRATRAAELFREGKASFVVASGRQLRPNVGIAELMEHDLLERGVPKDRILRFVVDGDSTQEEAIALANLAKTKKWRKIIVVTSNYHTRRARYIFRTIFPQGIEVRVASARDADFDPQSWWQKRKSAKLLVREIAGLAEAMWELRQESETPRDSPGIVDLRGPSPLPLV